MTSPFCLCWHHLFYRSVARQVSSARVSLTSVFGMGTGGPSPQSAPTYFSLKRKVSKRNFNSHPLGLLHYGTFFSLPFLSTVRYYIQLSSLCQEPFIKVLFANFFSQEKVGDPWESRTPVCGVRGRRLDHLTNGPWCAFTDSNRGPTD